MKHAFVMSLFTILAVSMNSQTITSKISIKIKDAKTKEPLIGANVLWKNTTIGAVTNEKGIAEIDVIDSLPHEINISYIGYQPDSFLVEKGIFNLWFDLDAVNELENVTVQAKQLTNYISTMDAMKTEKIGNAELKKAACCNLSEAFSTNSSVDVNYSDAVTGAKEIKLLGLSGIYIQNLIENQPFLRGISSAFGLDNIPAPWIKSISISKGTPTVRAGYEGISGSLNVALKNIENEKQKLLFDMFGSSDARIETNFIINHKIKENMGTTLFFNGAFRPIKMDNNKDGFLDQPLMKQYNFGNNWMFTKGKTEGHYFIKVLSENREAGQANSAHVHHPDSLPLYVISINNKRVEAFAKTGFILNEASSIGTQFSGFWHQQKSNYGNRNYDVSQGSFTANILYQTTIKNENNSFVAGASFVYDNINEQLDSLKLKYEYYVPGIFSEYTFKWKDKITLVAGLRFDYHNKAKFQINPRINLRYQVAPNTTLRFAAGKGFRVPFTLSENQYLLASSRKIVFDNLPNKEVAWNYGISLLQKFTLKNREGSFNVDVYRTDFVQQQVVDIDNADALATLSSLKGKSNATSVLAEINYEVIKGFDAKLAYKWELAKTTYHAVYLQKPLTNQHKGLIALSYKTPKHNWQFDVNMSINGKKRLPNSFEGNSGNRYTKAYTLLNAQISKTFKNAELFIGGENLTNFKQQDPIIGSDQPFGKTFDTNQVWAPIMGATAYGGFRLFIN
jgi:hypothetical protein